MKKQDGKASIPLWYRKWIIKKYGDSVMNIIDVIGGIHDEEIIILGWSKANRNMIKALKEFKIPYLFVRLPISLGIRIYSCLPNPIKRFYWNE